MTEKINGFIESDFDNLGTPFEITQFFRGELFIYVDWLFGYEFENLEEELPPTISFLNLIIDLIVKFLKKLPKKLAAVCIYSFPFQFQN
jgi:hypothetical protein